MNEPPATRVLIEKRTLRGSQNVDDLQKVATVYLNSDEYHLRLSFNF